MCQAAVGVSKFCGRQAMIAMVISVNPLLAQRPVADVRTTSPDGRIMFALTRSDGGAGGLSYSVSYRGITLVEPSVIGLSLIGQPELSSDVVIGAPTRMVHDGMVRGLIGKASAARDHYRETVVSVTEAAAPRRRLELVVRAFDDGVAFRYRIPAQPALDTFSVADERTQLSIDAGSVAYGLIRDAFVSSYEGYYRVAPLSEFPADTLLALPLLVHHTRGPWFAVMEADLTDYAGMYLRTSRTAGGPLQARLSPLPGSPGVAVRSRAPRATPWRVIMIADAPARLMESNLLALLNPPSAITDVSWIHPGKTTFPWWNDYVVPDTTFKGGLNTATAKYYIDFCAAHGIPYHTLDGYDDKAWYGGGIDPGTEIHDVTVATPAIDLPEVLRHAKARGVRMRAWMHWRALKPQIDTAFARYERMGFEGIMVDFMDRDDQEMVNFYHEVLSKAAAHHLTVVFHGAYKPTGASRTWPNLMTVEAVLGLEYDKFDGGKQVTPAHELLVPFTRMLAGPIDFHQGGFRYFTESAFRTIYTFPRVIGTRARSLATYIVYEDYLPMMADAPSAYEGQPGLAFAAATPTTWDEIRVLQGTIGELIVVARRKGAVWYVGTMNDGRARDVDIPLAFLGAGSWSAEIFSDALRPGETVLADSLLAVPRRERRPVQRGDTIHVRLAPAGGHAIRLTRTLRRSPAS